MTQYHQNLFAALCVGLALVSGCKDSKYPLAHVAGRVTLDGIPVPNARISFEPIGDPGEQLVGPGSFAVSDAEGRYELRTIQDDEGAVIGKHRVTIRTFQLPEGADMMSAVDQGAKRQEQIPARYNDESTLTFVVPPSGTVNADFAMASEP